MERQEIYPFQRALEHTPPAGRQRKKKYRFKMPEIKLPAVDKTEIRNGLMQLLKIEYLVLAAGAFIMSRAFILGELLPFLYALAAAFAWQDRNRTIVAAVFSVLGLVTVLDGTALWFNILSILVLMAVMTYVKIPAEKSWWGLPFMTTAVIFLSKSIMLLLTHFYFYQEMIIIFEAMLAGILTFIFMIINDVFASRKAVIKFKFEETAAFVILGIGLIMGLNDVQVAGLGVSSIFCRLGILIAAFLWGSSGGTMVGVMAGIIPSISSSIFAQSLGMYAFSGLLAGVFRNFGRLGVIIGFMLGNLAISMFIAEEQVALMGVWETALASLVFFVLPESLKEKVPVESLGTIQQIEANQLRRVDNRIKASVGNRIQNLAEVFDELSSTFTSPSYQTSRPQSVACLNYLYDELSHGFCEGCTRYNSCWDRDYYNTSHYLLDIFTNAEAQGQVSYEDCPSDFKRKCIHGRELISTVNYLFDNLRMNEYWSGKIDESRELVARQLKGVSQVVKNLAEEVEVDTVVDFELRDVLVKASLRQGINLKDITPIRTSGKQLLLEVVAGSCVDGTGCDLSIAPAISSIMGEKMEVCSKTCPRFKGQGACEFTLTRAFAYNVQSAVAQVARENVSGDSYTITTLDEGKELLVLSDGMGVGELASNQSQTAVNLLENLLNSGFNKDVALKTINSVLLLRSTSETFTTLDMVLIDLYTGEVDFVKTASSPSFIKRGKKVAMISSNSLPIGILNEVELVNERRTLLPHDMILMVSDGVMESSRSNSGEEWISQLFSDLNEKDPQVVAETVINKALSLSQGKPNDDMTVICMSLELR
ncbi:MAG: stage II sporulation protein E [Syntrophomonas sp.]|nr:stage II sporulation protein E [Syntrophomonas sp.]